MENKKFTDASLEEFKNVMKDAYRYAPCCKKFVLDFLGIKLDNLFSTKQSYPQFKMPIVCSIFPEFLKEENFVIDRLSSYNYDGDAQEIKRVQVEISENKTTDVIIVGVYFLIRNNKKFVISINFEENNRLGFVYFYSSNENKEEASQIVTNLDLRIKNSNFFKGKKITPYGKFLKLKKNYTWEDVIFPKELEEEIKRNIENYLRNFEIYRKNGLPAKRGILLSGLPGVGKTQLGKVLVCTLEGVTFVWVTPKYFNECLDVMDHLFDLVIENAPTILFMEDVDFYGVSRERGNNSTVLGEFLNKVDGLVENNGVLIIMTTNYPEILDKAIKERPGRFDRVIQIIPPKVEERHKMLHRFCKDLKTDEVNWNKLTDLTEGFTGALLNELIITASSFAIEDNSLDENSKVILKQKHFDLSFDTLKKYSKMKEKGVPGFRRSENDNYEEECTSECAKEVGNSYEDDTGVIE